MNIAELTKQWLEEENAAFAGWDFSRLDGRWEEPELPWDYFGILKSHLKPTDILLDMGTGGGEFLLTIGHPHANTYVTEAYPPNYELCLKTLTPLGITVAQTYEDDKLPFEDNTFDIIINRHESFDLAEVRRVLKSGGHFITQQVGNMNSNDLLQRLNDNYVFHNPAHRSENYIKALCDLGFDILMADDIQYPVKFHDVGALVYYAKAIPWEFPNFAVDTHIDRLLDCQQEVKEKGFLQSIGHRFYIVARNSS